MDEIRVAKYWHFLKLGKVRMGVYYIIYLNFCVFCKFSYTYQKEEEDGENLKKTLNHRWSRV